MKLVQLAPNLHCVEMGNRRFWFSYETIVAFEVDNTLNICENVWSKTTGKHINMISRTSPRVSASTFSERLRNVL